MAEQVCKKCDAAVPLLKDAVKCVDCASLHHLACVGEKKPSRRGWKCELCVGETSSTGSRASETAVLDAIHAFRKELNDRMDLSFEKMNTMQEDIATVKNDLSAMNNKYGELKAVVEEATIKVDGLQAENHRLSAEVRVLTKEVEDLQQHTRKANLIVSGVPVTPRENVFLVLETLARLIDVEYRRSDISAAHRLPAPQDGRPPSIVVCFVSRLVKEEWLRAKKNVGNLTAKDMHNTFPDQPIYVNEHLTRQTRDIFNAARALVRSRRLAMVWTSDCRVLAKRSPSSNPFRVLSLRQVRDLAGKPDEVGAAAVD